MKSGVSVHLEAGPIRAGLKAAVSVSDILSALEKVGSVVVIRADRDIIDAVVISAD